MLLNYQARSPFVLKHTTSYYNYYYYKTFLKMISVQQPDKSYWLQKFSKLVTQFCYLLNNEY